MQINFPNRLVSRVEILRPGIGARGDEALQALNEKGYTIGLGLTEYYAGGIGVMGYQPRIREFCPKDSTSARFETIPSTEKWIQKGGGRAVLLLLEGGETGRLAGYGWTGYEPCEQLPNHPITSAYRIGERDQRKGFGKHFVQVVVSATNAIYAPGVGVGLETWSRNHAAKMYQDVGFVLLNKGPEGELRPTLDPQAIDGMVPDQRLYMGYPSELLAV